LLINHYHYFGVVIMSFRPPWPKTYSSSLKLATRRSNQIRLIARSSRLRKKTMRFLLSAFRNWFVQHSNS